MYSGASPAPLVFAGLVLASVAALIGVMTFLANRQKTGHEVPLPIWRGTVGFFLAAGMLGYILLLIGHMGYVAAWQLDFTSGASDTSAGGAALSVYFLLTSVFFLYAAAWFLQWAHEEGDRPPRPVPSK